MVELAVLGPGNGGTAMAADLTLAGHRVRVWGRNEAVVAALRDGPVVQRAVEREGTAHIAEATTDLAAALAGAEVVLCTVPGFSHREVSARIAEAVEPGQIVVFMPGSFGSFELARALRDRSVDDVVVAECATLPYGARRRGSNEVFIPLRASKLPVGVFPAHGSDAVIAKLREVYPQVVPVRTILDAGLLNPNVPIHSALMVTNAGAIEHFAAYDIHAQGTTPATRRVIDALDAERIALREALGYGAPHYEQSTYYDPERRADGMWGSVGRELVESSGAWHEKLHLQHRYVTEDVAQGLSLHVSLGEAFDVPVPTSVAVVQLARILSGLDFADRRTLEGLGLGGLSRDDLDRLLTEGW